MTLTCLPVGMDPVDLRRAFRRFGTGMTVITTRAADKFAGVPFSEGLDGLPLLDGCAATIECAVIDEHLIGDHVLFIGQVRRYAYEQADPLLFFNGQYVQAVGLHAPQPS